MDQIQRIQENEERLRRAGEAMDRMEEALTAYRSAREDLELLERYCESDWWQLDRSDYEDGKLPEGLGAQVLTQEGTEELLVRREELMAQLVALLGCY